MMHFLLFLLLKIYIACLTNPHCNKNYYDCSCKPGEISSDCRNICKCKLSICNPGFIGKKCEQSCPAGTFGSNCIGKCLCKEANTNECSKENGDCKCKPNYYGIWCEYPCESNGKLVCDTPYSCKCVIESKLTDENDPSAGTLSLKRENSNEAKNSNHGLIFSLIGLLLVTVSLSLLLFYKYKVKTKKLKRDLKSYRIQYSSGGSNDQFDNPVYSYAATTSNLPSVYNGYNASTYAPSSITTATLPHPARLNSNAHLMSVGSSLTTPRQPKQNGYLNDFEKLSILPTDLFMKKNALADATNPNLMMRRDDTFNSNLSNNIYTTIDEVRNVKNANSNNFRNEFENDFGDELKHEFSTNFNDEKQFKIPEDNDSVDIHFMQIEKKNELKPFNEKDEFLMHYDRPKPKSFNGTDQQEISLPLPLQQQQTPTYETPKSINEKNQNQNLITEELNKEASHYDYVDNKSRTYGEALKK